MNSEYAILSSSQIRLKGLHRIPITLAFAKIVRRSRRSIISLNARNRICSRGEIIHTQTIPIAATNVTAMIEPYRFRTAIVIDRIWQVGAKSWGREEPHKHFVGTRLDNIGRKNGLPDI